MLFDGYPVERRRKKCRKSHVSQINEKLPISFRGEKKEVLVPVCEGSERVLTMMLKPSGGVLVPLPQMKVQLVALIGWAFCNLTNVTGRLL